MHPDTAKHGSVRACTVNPCAYGAPLRGFGELTAQRDRAKQGQPCREGQL
jgi:hypothetical protein